MDKKAKKKKKKKKKDKKEGATIPASAPGAEHTGRRGSSSTCSTSFLPALQLVSRIDIFFLFSFSLSLSSLSLLITFSLLLYLSFTWKCFTGKFSHFSSAFPQWLLSSSSTTAPGRLPTHWRIGRAGALYSLYQLSRLFSQNAMKWSSDRLVIQQRQQQQQQFLGSILLLFIPSARIINVVVYIKNGQLWASIRVHTQWEISSTASG